MLDAIDRRFRLKVALEGAVAEVHFERKLKTAVQEGWLEAFAGHDVDGMHDFTILCAGGRKMRVEVKTVRNAKKLQVEIQKTRAAKGDPSSRFYNHDHFDVIAVCMGRQSGDWSQFRYVLVSQLPRHPKHPEKLSVMNSILDGPSSTPRWYSRLKDTIDAFVD
jgi:hypothetical protein